MMDEITNEMITNNETQNKTYSILLHVFTVQYIPFHDLYLVMLELENKPYAILAIEIVY